MSKDSIEGGEGKISDPLLNKPQNPDLLQVVAWSDWPLHKGVKTPFVQLQKCPLVHVLALGTFVTAVCPLQCTQAKLTGITLKGKTFSWELQGNTQLCSIALLCVGKYQ